MSHKFCDNNESLIAHSFENHKKISKIQNLIIYGRISKFFISKKCFSEQLVDL